MASEIDETMKRLLAHKGVQTVVIFNNEGIVIRTAGSAAVGDPASTMVPALVQPLVQKARKMIRELDATNEFQTMRVRSVKNELLVYPERDYTLVVIQAATI